MKSRIVAMYAQDGRYTRHSEGAFLRRRDGSILFVWSRFTGRWNDDAPSHIAGSVSRDEGETWSEPRTLIEAELYGAENVMSASLLRMADGEMGLFYIVKQTDTVNRIMLSRSRDEGETFYRHIDCTADIAAGYYVLNNDRVIRLTSGRLVMPLAYHRGGHSSRRSVIFDGRAFDVFLLSDDDGETWREGRAAVFPPFTHTDTGLQEPGVIERKNGTLYGYARTDQGCQYEFYSPDGGETWSPARPSVFTSPASPMKIARMPDGGLCAVWNPEPAWNGRQISRAGWGRTPLVMSVSRDEGASWSAPETLENDPEHGYCYPALFFGEGYMLAAYCSGGPEDGACLARLTIRRVEFGYNQ